MSTKAEILKNRAVHYSQELKSVDEQQSLKMLGFYLHPETYAIDYEYVKEVKTVHEVCTIPGTPDFIMGIINYRGKMLSVMNLKVFFGLNQKGLTEFNKLIILGKGSFQLGILTDGIFGNMDIDEFGLSNPPLTVSGPGSEFIKAVSPDGTIIIDTKKLINSEQIIVNQ